MVIIIKLEPYLRYRKIPAPFPYFLRNNFSVPVPVDTIPEFIVCYRPNGLVVVPVPNVCVCSSVVDPKLFFSDPDPTFQEIPDPDPISDPT